MCVSALETT